MRPFIPHARLNAVRARLAALFPACIAPDGAGRKRPLKVGIHNDLIARLPESEGITPGELRLTIARYCSGRRYAEIVAKGGMRIDLDGNEVEPVSEHHRQHAQFWLDRNPKKAAAA